MKKLKDLTWEEQDEIVQAVGDAVLKGCRIRAAYRQVAEEWGCGWRKIAEVWRDRRSLYHGDAAVTLRHSLKRPTLGL